jgi:hypothetical protein
MDFSFAPALHAATVIRNDISLTCRQGIKGLPDYLGRAGFRSIPPRPIRLLCNCAHIRAPQVAARGNTTMQLPYSIAEVLQEHDYRLPCLPGGP